MANKLLEAYSKRIAVAESVYAKEHDGAAMDRTKKITLNNCYNNNYYLSY